MGKDDKLANQKARHSAKAAKAFLKKDKKEGLKYIIDREKRKFMW